MQTDHASAAHTIRRGHLRDLEIYVKNHSRSLEMEPLDRSYTTGRMAVSVAVCEIFSVKEWLDLENQVRGHSR